MCESSPHCCTSIPCSPPVPGVQLHIWSNLGYDVASLGEKVAEMSSLPERMKGATNWGDALWDKEFHSLAFLAKNLQIPAIMVPFARETIVDLDGG